MAPAITAAPFQADARATPVHSLSSANFASANRKPRGSSSLLGSSRQNLARLEEEIAAGELAVSASVRPQHIEAEKSLVAATHQRDAGTSRIPARRPCSSMRERDEIARLRAEAESARARADQARSEHAEARSLARRCGNRSRGGHRKARRPTPRFSGAAGARRRAPRRARHDDRASASAEGHRADASSDEIAQANERTDSLAPAARRAHPARKPSSNRPANSWPSKLKICAREKTASRRSQRPRSKPEWDEARSRTGQIDETLRGRRQSLDELRAERSQRQIEKARNDADRDYLRQTCVAELNAQPEELIGPGIAALSSAKISSPRKPITTK